MKSNCFLQFDSFGSPTNLRSGRIPILMLAVLAVVMVALLIASVAFLTRAPVPAALPIPTPNAYGQMVRLGGSVQGVPTTGINECSAVTLTEFLDANRQIIAELDSVLQNESVVPIGFSQDYLEVEFENISRLRQLLRVIDAKAKLAQMEDRPVDAADGYVTLLIAARKIQRGGLFIHMQVGCAYERVAWPALGELASQLSADEKANVAWQIQSLTPRDKDFLSREIAIGKKQVGRVRMFLMRSHTAATNERNMAIIAELEAAEKAAMSKLIP